MENERKGEIYMLIQALFESWFPIIIIFAYSYITPIFAYSINIFLATTLFLFILFYKKRFGEFKNKEGYKDLLLTTLFITLLFLFVFLGLQYTTATNMAVILFLQLLFSFLYFNVIGKEYISRKHILGATLMGFGAIVILFPDDFTINKGDILVLLAAMIAPLANYYQKRARAYVSVETVLAFRYILSLPFLLILAFILEPTPSVENLENALPYLLLSGFLVFGVAKIFWVEAIYLIPITKATALAAFVPPMTILFAYLLLDEIPTLVQIIAIIPIILGGYLITRAKRV